MIKADTTTYITVGKIGSTYGVRGWLRVQTYTEFNESILEYSPWYLNKGNVWTPVVIEQGKRHGKEIIVKLADVNTPEEARLLTGKLVAIPRSDLPPLKENEYYWSDLVGLTVINKAGTILGKVIYLMETGSNDVMVVKGEKEVAIPYLPDRVVLNVDLQKQEILVDWELI